MIKVIGLQMETSHRGHCNRLLVIVLVLIWWIHI